MISLEAIGYIERLLATRGITDYYLDVYSLEDLYSMQNSHPPRLILRLLNTLNLKFSLV